MPREFYERDTQIVAKELLGKLLVRRWRGRKIVARINEVESYVGEDDKASHASRGRTPRTSVMYGRAGRTYVYLIYGMYYCLNVVTEKKGFPAAVLIRGVQLESSHVAAASWGKGIKNQELGSKQLLNGPGKLTKFLHITRAQNRLDLTKSDSLFVADDGFEVAAHDILATPRIGVDYAGEHAQLPWRYLIQNAPADSSAQL